MIQPLANAKHILVVEIDEHMGSALRYNLECLGYRVTTQTNGLAAAECVQEGEFDLVTFDLDSPLSTGLAFVDILRSYHEQLPVVLLSSNTLREQRYRGYKIAEEQFVVKPFDLDDLMKRVADLTPTVSC